MHSYTHTCTRTIHTHALVQAQTIVVASVAEDPTSKVDLRDGSAQTIVRAATLRQALQIKLSISLSHSLLTQGQPVLALTV